MGWIIFLAIVVIVIWIVIHDVKVLKKEEELRNIRMQEFYQQREEKRAERELRMNSSADKSYTAQDWHERRIYVLNRDGYKCRNCGGKSGLQVHHIIPRSQSVNHHVDNLITLCVYCHSNQHNANFVPAAIENKLRLSQQHHSAPYKKRKSRKEHYCSDCRCLIEKGTIYYFVQYGKSRRYIQKKLCEKCFLTSSSRLHRF